MHSACHVHDPRYTFLPDHGVFIFVSQRIHVESLDVQDQSWKSYDHISSKQRSMTRTYLRKRSTGRGYRRVSRYGGSPTHDDCRHEDELHMGTSSPFGEKDGFVISSRDLICSPMIGWTGRPYNNDSK
jgi:hypothetical protein